RARMTADRQVKVEHGPALGRRVRDGPPTVRAEDEQAALVVGRYRDHVACGVDADRGARLGADLRARGSAVRRLGAETGRADRPKRENRSKGAFAVRDGRRLCRRGLRLVRRKALQRLRSALYGSFGMLKRMPGPIVAILALP